ncbi:hypothetical protein A3J15_03190 [Candidatus Roizmanbacteria bacterium RIFCSPLOWO2_02_FULL_38_10]|uniref:Glycosyl transferase family 1 domain-containing protein n=1 Tax=Candidatus Roizmanbacteria bacterium RIFCSPLOWO2_02_FULL_38_10 TaxID=1802074 RepID=A0A1F7JL78_9BACT|nr:MAG: hypothetical protein A3J15_03190 [Candidatus Roizmanbacteria bacterium RIFCSPLOWO2_02_FULL_38_10]
MVSIDQFVDTLVPNDAISNYCLQIKDLLQNLGFTSRIYCQRSLIKHPDILDYRDFDNPESRIIFHHSTFSPLVSKIIEMKQPKILIYHNITPAAYFRNDNFPYYLIFKEAERQNYVLRQTKFEAVVGDSKYNLKVISALLSPVKKKFVHPPFLTLQFKKSRQDTLPIDDLVKDKYFNIIFVGRIVANKKQDDLVKVFEYYSKFINPKSRLILIGFFSPNEPVFTYLYQLIKKRQINNVIIKANVNPEKLASYYRSCQLFLSMSEHEGFGIPVLEAIYYGVPVLSYRIPAMEEVLPPANLFDSKDVQKVADKIAVIQIDKRKKNKLIRDQSKILNKFQDNILIADFVKLIKSSFNL